MKGLKLLGHSGLLLLLITLLSGCSGEENGTNSTQTAMDGTPFATPITEQKSFGSLDISSIEEALFQGQPALTINFSKALDPLRSYQQWIEVSDDKQRKVRGGWVLSESGTRLYFTNIRPRQTYTVEVNAGLVAADKSRLGEGHNFKLTINNLKAVAGFSGKGMIIPAGSDAGLPIRSINVETIQVDYFRISADHLQNILAEFEPASSGGQWRVERLMKEAELVYNAQYQLPKELNKRIETKLPLDSKVTKIPGVYFAVLTRAGVYDYQRPITYFTVSDIGLHLREYRNQWSVFSSKLATGEANKGVQVRVLDNKGTVLSEGITNAKGMLNLPRQQNSRLLIAKQGEHLAVLNMNGPALDISEFDLPTKLFQQREYFIYGPRDLYRPGEEISFSILLRDFDGQMISAVPLVVDLVRPDGVIANSQQLAPQKHNYYQFEYQLSSAAQTGSWDLRVHLKNEKASTSQSFLVEDFLPERIKVGFSQIAGEIISQQQLNQIKVKADYLYGAPAAGNKMSAQVRVSLARSPFTSLKGFVFGDADDNGYGNNFYLEEQTLNDNGEASLKFDEYMINHMKQIKGPVRLDIRASVFESGGRAVERALPVYSWQAGVWAGIKAEFDINDNTLVNKQAGFQLVSVDENGTPLAGRELTVTLVNLNRQSYWEYFDGDGWRYEQIDNPFNAWQQQFYSEDKPLRIQPPVEKGFYQLKVTDNSGNTSSINFKIGQEWWGYGKSDDAARPDKITITLDRPAYNPGETVQLQLQAPRPGKGFLIVENGDGVLSSQMITVGDKAESFTVDIPADGGNNWKRHDVRIVALLVQPEAQARKGVPMRSLGIQPLPLDRSDKKISLSLTAPEKIEPQTRLKVQLKADGISLKQMMVTISAVDLGVLSVTDFETPDPFEFFYQLRRPEIDARDNFAEILHVKDLAFAKQRYGGDAASLTRGGEKPASEILIVSLFKGPVTIDAEGNAEVEFEMPDFNGAVRLMATIFSDDSFGAAEKEVKVSAPIVTQLSLPRFASLGDETQLTLDIQNTLAEKQQFEVSWKISGASLLDQKSIQSVIELESNQKQVIQLPIKITQATGTAEINFQVIGDGINFNRKWVLGLRPAYPAETIQKVDYLGVGEISQIENSWLDGKLAESLQLQLSVTANPPLNTTEQWRALLQYPYGCLEQTTSRARPLAVADEKVRERWQVALPKNMNRVKAVQDAINRLQTMQRSEGGFGLWSAHSREELWLTSYVTEFLLSVGDKGFQVPENMLSRALNRLQSYVKNNRLNSLGAYYGDNSHYRFAYRSYAAFVLAQQGKAPLGTLRQWFDKYSGESKSPLPLMHLAVALKLQGDSDRAAKAVAAAEKVKRNKHNYLGDYGSVIRDEALLLTLNLKHNMNLKDAELRMFRLSDEIYRKNYLSTQEMGAILQLALALESADNNNPWSAELKVAAETKAIKGSGNWSQVLKGERAAFATLEVKGKQKLFVSQTMIANSVKAPKAEANGFNIHRSWFDTSGKPLNSTTVNTGDFVIVKLDVTADDRSPDSLIVDLIPAGFELENPSLKHSTPLSQFVVNGKPLAEINNSYTGRIKHKEYRDDRFVVAVDLRKDTTLEIFYLMRAVTPGKYQVPSAFVEDMYRPENRAIGIPFKAITVKAK